MSNIDIFVWEFLGTAVLCLLGNGAVAAVVLKNSFSHGGGGDWVVIVIGWGLAVFAGASIASPSGAHINPAVTLAVAMSGGVPWSSVPVYWAGQLLGGFVGAWLCWAAFKLQFDNMEDNSGTRGIFCTSPAVRRIPWNIVTEVIATFVLVFWILTNPQINTSLGYAAVSFVVITIGFGLGGPTGYAINPARDLGPRLAYALMPIKGKADAGWDYAWVPVLAPLIGAALAAGVAGLLPAV
ncbi:MIP/aquaporin family protein [Mycolicibacterium canariasense]|uniref:MIP/aquaporin family protein n=1 Tax=Mycolicibacterium canariasense TaxID=228230 RepID=UPI0007885EDF|nr:MIP/aquaporin family protein [Mycolicibacterium canariasense]MCV7207988.1 aquaporin family protein [Mycolicibacterium canariasense]ORV11154.1 glycerol transporter [Mycolicibacterium canariasense]